MTLRIIGGAWRGRQLVAPITDGVRPTGDRVREAWFSILQYDVPGATVVDLCAGTGALGIEALSRGASHVTFVDSSAIALAGIAKNLTALGALPSTYTLQRTTIEQLVPTLPAGAFSLALADPPYAEPVATALAAAWLQTPFATVLSIEHASHLSLGGGADSRRYGHTAVTFFRV